MARGWESKSVEAQIEERSAERGETERRPAPEDVDRQRKRESLELSRRRVVNDLAGARNDVHRAALENALRFLDEELKKA